MILAKSTRHRVLRPLFSPVLFRVGLRVPLQVFSHRILELLESRLRLVAVVCYPVQISFPVSDCVPVLVIADSSDRFGV